MLWQGRRESENVEDERGSGGGGRLAFGGGIGFGSIVAGAIHRGSARLNHLLPALLLLAAIATLLFYLFFPVGKIGERLRISSSALDAMLKRCGSIAHHENHVDRRSYEPVAAPR